MESSVGTEDMPVAIKPEGSLTHASMEGQIFIESDWNSGQAVLVNCLTGERAPLHEVDAQRPVAQWSVVVWETKIVSNTVRLACKGCLQGLDPHVHVAALSCSMLFLHIFAKFVCECVCVIMCRNTTW